MVSLAELGIALGILLGFFLGWALASVPHQWRLMLGCMCTSVLFLLTPASAPVQALLPDLLHLLCHSVLPLMASQTEMHVLDDHSIRTATGLNYFMSCSRLYFGDY